jgi:hypothetical protein
MKFALKSRIRAFLATLHHAVTMTSTPQSTYFELTTGPGLDIESYRNVLIIGYEGCDKERVNAMHVTELRLLKQLNKPSGHEYIAAAVITPDGSTKYLAIERLCGPLNDSQSNTSLPPTTSQGDVRVKHPLSLRNKLGPRHISSTSSIASLDSLSRKHDARDVIQVLDKPVHKDNDICYSKLNFTSSNPLYLYQLVILALTLHESETFYRLFSKNCYWFAGSLMDILGRMHDIPLLEEEGHRHVQAGTWNMVPVKQKIPDHDMDAIIKEHHGKIRVFKQTVSFPDLISLSTSTNLLSDRG